VALGGAGLSNHGAMLRFEIMPFPKGEAQAAELPEPVRLTVTTSPKHGVDHPLDVSERLRALGHGVTVHLAAWMVRDRAHLECALLRWLEGVREQGVTVPLYAGVPGLHLFTFNELVATYAWSAALPPAASSAA